MPFPADLSIPGIQPGSPALQVNSLPNELSGKLKRGSCGEKQTNNRVQFSSFQLLSRVRLCDLVDCSTSGLPVHHLLPEFTQTHVH